MIITANPGLIYEEMYEYHAAQKLLLHLRYKSKHHFVEA